MACGINPLLLFAHSAGGDSMLPQGKTQGSPQRSFQNTARRDLSVFTDFIKFSLENEYGGP